jgi:hypothetical protein
MQTLRQVSDLDLVGALCVKLVWIFWHSEVSEGAGAQQSVIKVSWLSVQIDAEAIRTHQHAVFVRG